MTEKYKDVKDISQDDIIEIEYEENDIIEGEKLFRKPCNFVLGVANLSQLPLTEMGEIAFAGRSNVGKSTIINALTGQTKLAKTSNTPGRTQQLNYFNLDEKIHIVDLPGYGFAQAPENVVKQWKKLILSYLQGRVNLTRVFVLIDSRHGIKNVDNEIMELLDKSGVNYQIVLTKSDKISKTALEKVIQKTKKDLSKHPAAHVNIIPTSSVKKTGIELLKAEIYKLSKL